MSKSKELNAPVLIPAELNFDQVTFYWSQLASWTHKHSCTMEELYRDYCHSRGLQATVPGWLHFTSHMFLECRAGRDLRHTMLAEQKSQPAGGSHASPRPANRATAHDNN